MLCKISHGSFGEIYKVNEETALKVVPHRYGTLKNPLELILYFTESNNLIHGINYEIDDKCYKILMPLAQEDLNKFIKKKRYKNMREDLGKALLELALGVQYLHSRSIVHGDIKPGNILIFKDNKNVKFKLTDFSISSLCNQKVESKIAYTSGFRAPEISLNGNYDFRADIWALGRVFEICRSNNQFLMENIKFNKLLLKMLEPNPNLRYTVYQVVNDDFFKDFLIDISDKELTIVPTFEELGEKVERDILEKIIDKMHRKSVYEEEDFLEKQILYIREILQHFRKNVF